MIGSFITRILVMIFGYAYPAYECYKAVEMNRPEIEQLRFWCQYWILVALLTVCERIGDTFISWVPMYSEAKLAFFIYLWYPKTKGTTYVYDSFFRPYVAKHETDIDRNLMELRTRAGDIAVTYWQKAASYGQTRVFDILQYVAAQSAPPAPPAQQRRQGVRGRQPAASNAPATAPPAEGPTPATSSSSSSQHQKEVAEELSSSQAPKAPSSLNGLNTQKNNSASESGNQSAPVEAEPMQIETALPSSSSPNENPPSNETVMEESIRVTRGRLRKNRSLGTQ
ncbi:putative HVA22-like protein g isoform X1 [Vicia villosa]|uniref:putative HVA22-like protein g isoform X1 n=1 Tax=Vicia villosa TaxID=3911 RepID=UPI00273B8004|nr:putative HVA22-like protein g isoform X1 [Vicia villosa]